MSLLFLCCVLLISSSLSRAMGAFGATTSTTSGAVSQHFHEFWRKPRTAMEVENHILACLQQRRRRQDSPPKSERRSSIMKPSVEVISAEPPLLIIHNFLSEKQCDEIIESAKESGRMGPSQTGATQQTNKDRTSSTAWLCDEDCPGPLRSIAQRVSDISGLPAECQENLQVVRYEPNQEFRLHTDHQDSFNDLECRGRLATCLLYLAEPTAGGETWFPGVSSSSDNNDDELCIQTKRGSAVFFWNTIEKPGCPEYAADMFLNVDLRLRHAGLPVSQDSTSEKWICNRWIHPTDFGAGVRGL